MQRPLQLRRRQAQCGCPLPPPAGGGRRPTLASRRPLGPAGEAGLCCECSEGDRLHNACLKRGTLSGAHVASTYHTAHGEQQHAPAPLGAWHASPCSQHAGTLTAAAAATACSVPPSPSWMTWSARQLRRGSSASHSVGKSVGRSVGRSVGKGQTRMRIAAHGTTHVHQPCHRP